VLKIFAPDLGNESDGRAENDGQFASRGQLFDDAKRNPGLAGSAGKNDLAARLACRQAAALGLLVLFQDADTLSNDLVLHTGFGLDSWFAVGVWQTVRALLMYEGIPLLSQINGNVDHLDGPDGH